MTSVDYFSSKKDESEFRRVFVEGEKLRQSQDALTTLDTNTTIRSRPVPALTVDSAKL